MALILIIYILLHISVKIYCSFSNSSYNIAIKYLGITLYKLSSSDKKEAAAEQEPSLELTEIEEALGEETLEETVGKEADAALQQEQTEEPNENKSLLDKWNEYKTYIPVGKKAVKKLLKLIRIYKLNLNIEVGDTDAYKAALNFGKLNTVFYPLLGLLCTVFNVKIEHTDICCNFNQKVFNASGSACIYLRPSAVTCLAIYLLINYLKISRKQKRLNKKESSK